MRRLSLTGQQLAIWIATLLWLVLRPGLALAIFLPNIPSAQNSGWGGLLADDQDWANYKSQFLAEDGRIVDTGSGGVSHSEGQGYGMLLAVAANDREAFDRIWRWTSAHLAVRDDFLFAWYYNPWGSPTVSDTNAATDGDLLIAWALLEAGEAWNAPAYVDTARRIAFDIGRKEIVRQDGQPILLPGPKGFSAAARMDGPVVNLSYWIFPALARLKTIAGDVDWDGVIDSGLTLIEAARFGADELPPEWMSLEDGLRPAVGLPDGFGYNALRIPLYMALAGVKLRGAYSRVAEAWRNGPVLISRRQTRDELTEKGYRDLAGLTQCIAGDTRPALTQVNWSAPKRKPLDETQLYFPATLQLLTRIAIKSKWPSCAPSAL